MTAVITAKECAHPSLQSRIEMSAVEQALAVARSRWPGQQVFFLSDTPIRLEGAIDLRELSGDQAELEIEGQVFVCAFDSDEKAIQALDAIQRGGGRYVNALQFQPVASYLHKNDCARQVLARDEERARADGLAHFDRSDFTNLIQCLEMTRDLPGDYLEIGVYQGSSARSALEYMRSADLRRRSWFLDTFAGFDYEDASQSADGRWWNTHGETSLEGVRSLLAEYSESLDFQVRRSNICEDDLPREIESLALCNIDVDLYEAVRDALQKVAPLMSPRGVIIVEDVGHTPGLGGAALALHQFMQSEAGRDFVQIYMESGQALLLRV
ncbi:MAG: TylF/MycF/NovP-related O-methyltransferase [Planctomycetota bacterium]